MLNSLKDRVVIVTGGSKGIGKGIARVFCQQGSKVLIVCRKQADGEATVDELTTSGGRAALCLADVSTREGCEKMAQVACETYGGIDVLCANAGSFPAVEFESMTEDDWDGIFAANVRSMYLSIQCCLPELKKSNCPRVVITSSITGPTTGFPGWSHYGATKAAQLGFLRTAAIEFARYGITVNAVLPGNIMTEALVGMGDEYINSTAASIPLGKLGQVDDIGHAAAFLASKEASFITGHSLVVDGGQILPESPSALS